MKLEKVDASAERTILIGMLVSDPVCARLFPVWEQNLFRSAWGNNVAMICMRFYKRYKRAPRDAFEAMFRRWCAHKRRDEETVKLMEDFITSLQGEYEAYQADVNVDYVIDMASQYFNEVRLENFIGQVDDALEERNIKDALRMLTQYKSLEIGGSDGIDVMQDMEAIRAAYEEGEEVLINFGGDLDMFFGPMLARDGFIAFLAPEKVGKTFWLAECTFRAIMQRRKVAFFGIGDMSEKQMIRRFGTYAGGLPKYPCVIDYPIQIKLPAKEEDGSYGTATVRHKKRNYTKGMSWQMAYKGFQKMQQQARTSDVLLKMCIRPAGEFGVSDLDAKLDQWERNHGFIPDVVVLDYADLLRNELGAGNEFEAINQNWTGLRALTQRRHNLLITATQATRAGYKAQVLGKEHVSDNKKKVAHVTGLVGLNQTILEKRLGIMRLNWIAAREHEFDSHRCAYVAEARKLARMAVVSAF